MEKTPLEKKLIGNLSFKNDVISSKDEFIQSQTYILTSAAVKYKNKQMLDDLVKAGYFSFQSFVYKGKSSEMGITSEIKEYTNKSGKSHAAHFTVNGKYLGPVSRLGETPISYQGYFRLSNLDKFEPNWDAVDEDIKKFSRTREVNYLFKLKKKITRRIRKVSFDSDDDS